MKHFLGGDNIFQVKSNIVTLDTQDEVLTRYIATESPINIELEGRIQNVNGTSTILPIGNDTVSGTGTPPTPTESGAGEATETPSMGSLVKAQNAGLLGVIFGLVACLLTL
jgi:hypothetical protein